MRSWSPRACAQGGKVAFRVRADWRTRTRTSLSAESFAAATEQERVSAGWPPTRGALQPEMRKEVLLRWLKPPL